MKCRFPQLGLTLVFFVIVLMLYLHYYCSADVALILSHRRLNVIHMHFTCFTCYLLTGAWFKLVDDEHCFSIIGVSLHLFG